MGPLILLSLFGIGAATAFVDVGSLAGPFGGSSDSDEPEQEQDIDDTQVDDSTEPRAEIESAEEIQAAAFEEDDEEDFAFFTDGDTISGTDDNDSLYARGTDNIDAGAGDDTLTSWGSGAVMGDEGNDVFDIGGTAQAFGGAGEDYMHISQSGVGFGGEGNDSFFLKSSANGDAGPAQADGGEGDDTFVMRPLSGLPEETVAHVLTGGAGADVYALDIDAATSIRDGDDSETHIVAHITDFDPDEDMLMVDIGASTAFDDVDTLPTPTITTVEDTEGGFTDVHISWTNPLNPDNVETRVLRLEGVQNFSAGNVELTSIFDADSHYNDEDSGAAEAHRLFALTPIEGSAASDTLHLSSNSAVALQGGNDHVEMSGGSHLIYGGEGNDALLVTTEGTGAAQLFGGEGDDELTADLILNNDTALLGGDGDDSITFGLGHYVDGGEGSDELTLNVHTNAMNQGPAVLQKLTGNHLTVNIPPELNGDITILNHKLSNGFEVAYSEILVGDVPILKVLEEDFTTGTGIADIDPRITFVRQAA